MHITTKTLGSLCEITSSKRIYAADYQSVGVPFYRSKEIIEKHKGNLEVSTELFISEDKYRQIESRFGSPSTGDLLLTSVGTLGIPYIVKDRERFYFKDGNLIWFKNFRDLSNQYFYYWLISSIGKAQLGRATIGSSQPALTIVLLKNLEINLPPLPVQKKIASILSAYDDLIENNNRRIKILEEMAQNIYREWFVHFRYPGHENIPMVNSALGQIPQGWEVRTVKNLVKRLKAGSTYTAKDVTTEGSVIVKDQSTSAFLGFHDNEPAHLASASNPIIIFGDHTCKMEFVTRPFSLGPNVIPFKSTNNGNLAYLYFLINSLVETREYKRHWTTLVSNEVIYAPTNVQEEFSNHIIEIFQLEEHMNNKNQNLRKTRDLLLPKLISGQLDVEELNIKV